MSAEPRPRPPEDPKSLLEKDGGKCLFGIETEYAFSAGEAQETQARLLLARAKEAHRHLRGSRGLNLYLENGARFYLDVGNHPEYCTPECSDPADLVRHLRAGDRIMADLAAGLADCGGGTLFKYNTDYSGANTTWGSHESYLHRRGQPELIEGLVPHLVSRVIYTGAGGFLPNSSAIFFVLAPRAWHLDHARSGGSTQHRGLVHLKDEPLAVGGYHRLHLLCGESLCSEYANWLRVGTTALVAAVIDRGLDPGDAVMPANPIFALRAFARDTACHVAVEMKTGDPMRAVDIQRHYLEAVEGEIAAGGMPPWAPELCRHWRRTLELLETDPTSLSTVLDWCMKLALFRRHAEASGHDWTRLPAGAEGAPLRRQLWELDVKFGQLGPEGIFNRLERLGVLNHRAPGVGDVDAARTTPPPGGRAELRGRYVRKLCRNEAVLCRWHQIVDLFRKRYLDMSDPFQTEAEWEAQPEPDRMRMVLEAME